MLRGEKGHSFFLDILQKIKIKWPNIRYIIAGSGEEHDLIYSKIRILGLEDNVLLAGMVDPIAPLIKKATIAVLPSPTINRVSVSQLYVIDDASWVNKLFAG
jgi:glycosyltransferase involved in cell wall biosynthesis